jgi:hypothetical protein
VVAIAVLQAIPESLSWDAESEVGLRSSPHRAHQVVLDVECGHLGNGIRFDR